MVSPEVGSKAAASAQVGGAVDLGARWRAYARRLAATDLLAIVLAEALALVVPLPGAAPADRMVFSIQLVILTVGLAAGWMWALSIARTRDRRVVGVGAQEYSRVASATWWTFAILGLASFVFQLNLARSYVAIAFPVGLVLLLSGRYVWRRRLLTLRLRGELQATVLVVGHLHRISELVATLQERAEIGYRVVGACVPAGESGAGEALGGVPILGDLSQTAALASELGVDVVAVSGYDTLTSDFVRRLGWSLEPSRTDLLLASSLAEVAGPRLMTTPVPGARLVHVDAPRFRGPKYLVKLVIDTIGAAVLMAITLPVFVSIAIAVRVTSPGPVLYRQRRVGRDGRPFTMYKFRTMVVDADTRLDELAERDEGNGLLFKMRDDPRVTRVGRFLRRFSLDELPQLLNVLRGEMSLVGPRPPLESEVARYDRAISRRLLVKPGMTGLWQVNGRSDLSLAESIRYDLYYVENWSLFGDLMIVWRTTRAVLKGDGAY